MDGTEAEKFISELELAVDRLRSLYEQYFMGIEKLEPAVTRKDVDRRIHTLRKEQIRNTAQRFRFQMVLQRYNTYQSYWQRVCREIEGGTYKRHVLRARQRFGDVTPGTNSVVPPPGAHRLDAVRTAELAELDRDFAPPALIPAQALMHETARALAATPPASAGASGLEGSHRPGPPPLPAEAKTSRQWPLRSQGPPAPPAKPAPLVQLASVPPLGAGGRGLTDHRVRELYRQYVEAKRRQNESTAAVTYEGVARTLRESSARLHEKHGKSVDFEVAVKDGRAVLKPVLR